jgi:FtsP/CotA-like multicopper oxidase with cupredoxin domain
VLGLAGIVENRTYGGHLNIYLKMNVTLRLVALLFSLSLITGLRTANATTTFSRPVLNVVDINPDPAIFEAELSADEQDVDIGGTTVHALIYKDDNSPGAYAGIADGIPVPQITVNVGDRIVLTFTNKLAADCAAIACDTSIHFHGIEADADSDGTGVTQNHLLTGEQYVYRFIVPRPGVYWFHTHMKPGPQTFAGMYGAFIVKDSNEPDLQGDGVIPAQDNTHTIVLSDTEFDADGDIGYLDAGVAVPWAILKEACSAGDFAACDKFTDGATLLVNGQEPGANTAMISAKSGAGVRLRLINTATNRYFRLQVSNNGNDNNIYRIGGEGGFLEQARLEGGTMDSWDTRFSKGEILLGSSQRADVVIVPTGNPGDIITVSGLGYSRGIFPETSNDPAFELLFIKIDNDLADIAYIIEEGKDLLGAGGVEDMKEIFISDSYIAPVATGNPGDGAGSINPIIVLNIGPGGRPAIDKIIGHFEDSGPDFSQVPYQEASRYAKTGDILELTLQNNTPVNHPFHHHGFSFQPIRVIKNSDYSTLYTFDYNEFVDVIDLLPNQSIVVRMRLQDRPRITDTRQEADAPAPDQFFPSGGAAGRWVMHCHLFHHAALGMITELVVIDTDRDSDGFSTASDCDDFNDTVNPGALEMCADGIDNNCNGIVDTDCEPMEFREWDRLRNMDERRHMP